MNTFPIVCSNHNVYRTSILEFLLRNDWFFGFGLIIICMFSYFYSGPSSESFCSLSGFLLCISCCSLLFINLAIKFFLLFSLGLKILKIFIMHQFYETKHSLNNKVIDTVIGQQRYSSDSILLKGKYMWKDI